MALMATRSQLSFDALTFLDAHTLRQSCGQIPDGPGVYLWFVRGGQKILDLTHYRETESRKPLVYERRAHLYTGAARDLRYRITQHLRNEDPNQSSPRKSLLAIERIFGAVTDAAPCPYDLNQEGGLTSWIHENVIFAIQRHANPFFYETQLLESEPSPFNIAQRRRHRYSKYLMAWRAVAFPSDWMADVPFGKFEIGKNTLSKVAQRKCLSSAVVVK